MPVNVTLEMVQQLLEQNALLLKQNEMLTETSVEKYVNQKDWWQDTLSFHH